MARIVVGLLKQEEDSSLFDQFAFFNLTYDAGTRAASKHRYSL